MQCPYFKLQKICNVINCSKTIPVLTVKMQWYYLKSLFLNFVFFLRLITITRMFDSEIANTSVISYTFTTYLVFFGDVCFLTDSFNDTAQHIHKRHVKLYSALNSIQYNSIIF